ncbi:MAG: hypothetical protein ABIK28_19300 [Planctomycetota bacterium]
MKRSMGKIREEARRLYLSGEFSSNAQLAHHCGVKPHTIGRWHRNEDWDRMRFKIDRRAGEMFVEKLATDRVQLNIKHFRYWDVLLSQLAESLKNKKDFVDVQEMAKIASIIDRAQRGQRLAKGLSISGDTEETIRAKAQADIQKLIDVFIDTVKEHVTDDATREKICRAVLSAIPEEEGDGAGDDGDAQFN